METFKLMKNTKDDYFEPALKDEIVQGTKHFPKLRRFRRGNLEGKWSELNQGSETACEEVQGVRI